VIVTSIRQIIRLEAQRAGLRAACDRQKSPERAL
jgi:hypothetical protein